MPLKVWPNTALGCNHQSICMPQLQPLCSAALVPNVLLRRDEGWVSPVQWSKPNSTLAPTQDSNPGGRIQNHKRWPLHYHCTAYVPVSLVNHQVSLIFPSLFQDCVLLRAFEINFRVGEFWFQLLRLQPVTYSIFKGGCHVHVHVHGCHAHVHVHGCHVHVLSYI